MIDHITTILWDMEIRKKVYSAGSQVKLLLTTDPIMLGSVNIILVSTYKTSTLQVFLPLQKYPKILIHNSNILNLIPCELDLKYNLCFDRTIITYEIQLSPSEKKVGFYLLDDKYFTFPYINYSIPNPPSGHQLPLEAKQNVWIIHIHGENPNKTQYALDEINQHQTPHRKSKVKISLCRRKSYQRTYLEDIHSTFY